MNIAIAKECECENPFIAIKYNSLNERCWSKNEKIKNFQQRHDYDEQRSECLSEFSKYFKPNAFPLNFYNN